MIKKINDINRRFTEVITEYMNAGLTVNTQTMSGTQGEIAKIDLTNGKYIYRIMVADGHENDMGIRYGWLDTKEITVERFEVTESTNLYGTLWNGRGEIISKQVFYKVNSDRRNEVYTDSLDEIREINEKHFSRYNREPSKRTVIPVTNMSDKEKVRDMVRQHKGYKSIRRVQIANIIKEVGQFETTWKVEFRNDTDKANLVIKRIKEQA